jgi:hypothetical protein
MTVLCKHPFPLCLVSTTWNTAILETVQLLKHANSEGGRQQTGAILSQLANMKSNFELHAVGATPNRHLGTMAASGADDLLRELLVMETTLEKVSRRLEEEFAERFQGATVSK